MPPTFLSLAAFALGFSLLFSRSQLCAQDDAQIPDSPRSSIAESRYEYHVDLNKVADDQLQVELTAPTMETDSVTFFIPKIVPGIYGAENYGRFVSDLTAIDHEGNQLDVFKQDTNSWRISNAKRLHKLTYNVDDSWEEFEHKPGRVKYRSAGSSFDAGERFIINHNCLFGYFDGTQHLPIQVSIVHPEELTAATSLMRVSENAVTDCFLANSYRELVDNPIVYGVGDKVNFRVANAEITIAVFSEDGKKHAEYFGQVLKPLMEAQSRYLGGNLPVEVYTFILVWENGPENSMLGDGLEHSHSTLVLLEGSDLEEATNFIRSICAHEFFHILMPLTIKSDEIAHYDFNDPKQSRHLWLYEGMTEYATIHMPMVEGLIDRHEFLKSIQQKIEMSNSFRKDVSLTDLSIDAMEMQDQYYNFYLKGTLACLCLDIELRELTQGKIGVQSMLKSLSQKYGKDGSFKDSELFDVIADLTEPEIREWFRKYIEGTEALPLEMTLAKVGIEYEPENHRLGWVGSPNDQQVQLQTQWLESASSVPDANHTFELLKSLVGQWKGKTDSGYEYKIEYSLAARDTVLIEHWHTQSGSNPMTLYHLDGDKLVATHYCPHGNQPRLDLTGQREDGTLEFEFQSATNLKSPDATHQNKFQIRYNGSDSLWRNEEYLAKGEFNSDAGTYARFKDAEESD